MRHQAILLHYTRDLAAAFDLDLAIGDCAGYVTAGADQEPLADDKLALEAATHLSLLNRSVAFEQAALGDLHLPEFVQCGLYAALDHEPIAALHIAREGYAAPDNHGA